MLVIVGLLLTACGGAAPTEDPSAALQAQVAELQAQLEAAQEDADTSDLEAQISELQDQLAAAEEAAAAEPEEEVEPVVVSWWHITSEPGPHQEAWKKMADDYMAANPNVVIEITILENEAFKSKLPTVMQAGDPPDLFQSWGGGTLVEYAKAGLLKDITADMAVDGWGDSFGAGALGVYAYDGKQYGVPWDMGAVGFWYNKALFAQAGIDAPPATWGELLEDVQIFKDAGITPIILGEGEKWPGMHMWSYLAVREGGKEAFDAAYLRTGGSFADAPFVKAGEDLQDLIALDPFQEGYLGMGHDDSEAIMGDGGGAMMLMGQWAPAVMATTSTSGGLGDDLGFFTFPAVEGGAGGAYDVLGGGNGIAVGINAEPEAIDFLRYLTSLENQKVLAELGVAIPVVIGAEEALTDPNMIMVSEAVAQADYYQLYYDQFLPPATSEVVNDATQALYAGTMTPEEVAQAIEDAYAEEIGE
ncbi:MAG: extracellular solute-binding protein [Anaerolineae bacterium]|nr:extracellular solute-binding protein [Anaerolineae bacterium]